MESELSKKQYINNSQDWRRATHQAPLSIGFPRHEKRSRLPFRPPGDLPNPEIKLVSPAWQVDHLPLSHQGRLSEGDEDESIYLPAQGFPGGSVVITCLPMQEMWVWSLSGKIPWRRKWQTTPVFFFFFFFKALATLGLRCFCMGFLWFQLAAATVVVLGLLIAEVSPVKHRL